MVLFQVMYFCQKVKWNKLDSFEASFLVDYVKSNLCIKNNTFDLCYTDDTSLMVHVVMFEKIYE